MSRPHTPSIDHVEFQREVMTPKKECEGIMKACTIVMVTTVLLGGMITLIIMGAHQRVEDLIPPSLSSSALQSAPPCARHNATHIWADRDVVDLTTWGETRCGPKARVRLYCQTPERNNEKPTWLTSVERIVNSSMALREATLKKYLPELLRDLRNNSTSMEEA